MTDKLDKLLDCAKESAQKAEEFEKYARTPEGVKEIIKYLIDIRTGGVPRVYFPKQRTEAVREIYNALVELREEMNFE